MRLRCGQADEVLSKLQETSVDCSTLVARRTTHVQEVEKRLSVLTVSHAVALVAAYSVSTRFSLTRTKRLLGSA